MTNPFVKSFIASVAIIGTGWALYCISPAGAAEREYTRQQSQQSTMYRKTKPNE